jgi:hypothetical protein
MITLKELNPRNLPLTPDQEDNLRRHHANLQKFRGLYAKPMAVTSGVRTPDRQAEIDALAGRRPNFTSRHIAGDATDFADPDGSLGQYCLDNLSVLQICGLFLESPTYSLTYDETGQPHRWVHLQSFPPRSGKRVFQPYPGMPPQPKAHR